MSGERIFDDNGKAVSREALLSWGIGGRATAKVTDESTEVASVQRVITDDKQTLNITPRTDNFTLKPEVTP